MAQALEPVADSGTIAVRRARRVRRPPRRLPRRLAQLYAGLVLYGVSMALLVRADLGVMPWDVLHQGLARSVGGSLGSVSIVVGALVLLLWVPLRQWPGVGTVSNVVVIGLAVDASLALLPAVGDGLVLRWLLVVAGVVLNAVATAAYIGVRLGPGPRDGLMTGLVARTGWSVRLVRTGIEVVVLSGWLLGGTLGVATALYALSIGPLVQPLLRAFTVGDGTARPGGGTIEVRPEEVWRGDRPHSPSGRPSRRARQADRAPRRGRRQHPGVLRGDQRGRTG
jgi:uncharacterized membrane protein YczE